MRRGLAVDVVGDFRRQVTVNGSGTWRGLTHTAWGKEGMVSVWEL